MRPPKFHFQHGAPGLQSRVPHGYADPITLAQAERSYEQAAKADPTAAEPHYFLGVIQARRGDLATAEACWRRALERDPAESMTIGALGGLLLSQGRFAEGFAFWEVRHKEPRLAKPDLPYPEWRGEPLAGKRLLVWPEQGLGDQIMFARFAQVLQRQGADVTFLCMPGLQRLLAGCLDAQVLAAAGEVSFPDPDYWVMTCSLGWRAGVTLETIPAAPYLRPVSAGPDLPQGFKVGLMTAGNPTHIYDAHRSLPPQEAIRLRGMDAVVVPLDPTSTGARDLADTAAIIGQLDLVVSVDTAVAHLAGAMGKPCWILVPTVGADWRWLRDRADSPWYPSARLYRQRTAGDWSEVVDRILADVAASAGGQG